MTAPAWTLEQAAAAQERRLDQRCGSCGATSAASSFCYRCLGTDLEYRIHIAGVAQWCQQGQIKPRKAALPPITAPEAAAVALVVQLSAGLA